MKVDLFKKLYEGEFKLDERFLALRDKLNKYYQQSEDIKLSAGTVNNLYKEFKEWCEINGYTRDEINAAKREAKILPAIHLNHQ